MKCVSLVSLSSWSPGCTLQMFRNVTITARARFASNIVFLSKSHLRSHSLQGSEYILGKCHLGFRHSLNCECLILAVSDKCYLGTFVVFPNRILVKRWLYKRFSLDVSLCVPRKLISLLRLTGESSASFYQAFCYSALSREISSFSLHYDCVVGEMFTDLWEILCGRRLIFERRCFLRNVLVLSCTCRILGHCSY